MTAETSSSGSVPASTGTVTTAVPARLEKGEEWIDRKSVV